MWKRGCIPVLSSLAQLRSPQGTIGTFTKIRKAAMPSQAVAGLGFGWGFFLEKKALHNLSTDSKNRVACESLGTGHISTHLLKAALISYHSPERVVDCIGMVQGLVTEKAA